MGDDGPESLFRLLCRQFRRTPICSVSSHSRENPITGQSLPELILPVR